MFEMNYKYNKEVLEWRKTRFEIHPLLHSRWSPSEMTGEQMSDQELFTLFEASRWAPSHYNVQPWRFIYAKKDSKYWQSFIDLLWPLNQKWCINASVLVMIISSKFYEHDGKQILYAIH
jgi:nitroreductase